MNYFKDLYKIEYNAAVKASEICNEFKNKLEESKSWVKSLIHYKNQHEELSDIWYNYRVRYSWIFKKPF